MRACRGSRHWPRSMSASTRATHALASDLLASRLERCRPRIAVQRLPLGRVPGDLRTEPISARPRHNIAGARSRSGSTATPTQPLAALLDGIRSNSLLARLGPDTVSASTPHLHPAAKSRPPRRHQPHRTDPEPPRRERAQPLHNNGVSNPATPCRSVQHAKPAPTGQFAAKGLVSDLPRGCRADFPQGLIRFRVTAGHGLFSGCSSPPRTSFAQQRSLRARSPRESIAPCLSESG